MHQTQDMCTCEMTPPNKPQEKKWKELDHRDIDRNTATPSGNIRNKLTDKDVMASPSPTDTWEEKLEKLVFSEGSIKALNMTHLQKEWIRAFFRSERRLLVEEVVEDINKIVYGNYENMFSLKTALKILASRLASLHDNK